MTRASRVLSLAAATIALAAQLQAQSTATRLSVPTDPVSLELLARARDAIEQKYPDRALHFWQDILDRGADKVIATQRAPRQENDADPVESGDRFAGVRQHVLGLICGLPEHGLQRYRELMKPRARRLLETSSHKGREATLRECARRYILTASGRRAYLALIDLLLEQGRMAEARVAAQRLRNEEVAVVGNAAFGLKVLAREALALWGDGRKAELRELAGECRKEFGESQIVIAGRPVAAATFIDQLLAKADRYRPLTLTKPPPDVRGIPWSRPFERNVSNAPSRYSYEIPSTFDALDHFPVVPVVRDDVVYYSDGLVLRGRNIYTGDAVWPGVPGGVSEFVGTLHRSLHHKVVVDDDLVIAYLEGEPLFERPWRRSSWAVPAHRLMAVGRWSGLVKWSHHDFKGRNAEETVFLSRLSVNQPPLLIGDVFYAAGTQFNGRFTHWICAFERSSGHLRWKTYLGAGHTTVGWGGTPMKASIPGLVAEHDGVLFYSTNMGVACAVDAVTGAIIWQSAYEQDAVPWDVGGRRRWRRHRYMNEPDPTWLPSRPAIAGNRVFFAPSDSSNLYAADVTTGKLEVVKEASSSGDVRNRCFLGIHQGLLLISGRRIFALDARDLSLRWRSSAQSGLARSMAVRGRPAVLGNDIVFTAAAGTGTAYRIDLRTGKPVDHLMLHDSERTGNVAVGVGVVVIATHEAVTAHFE